MLFMFYIFRERGLQDLMGLQDLRFVFFFFNISLYKTFYKIKSMSNMLFAFLYRENRDLLELLDQWGLEETLESWYEPLAE